MPTRLGRHGTALVPDPENALAPRPDEGRLCATTHGPLMEGCPCPACSMGLSRAYLGYLARAGELTGMRLLTHAQPRLHRTADGATCARRSSRAARSRRPRPGALALLVV